MYLRSISIFFGTIIVFAFFAKTSANSKSDLIIKQSKVECRLPVLKPWQKMPSFFGFGASLFQEGTNDSRVTFGLVITAVAGNELTESNLQSEIGEFHKAKKEFIEDIGGEFLNTSDSLIGSSASKIYRASVNYKLDNIEYRDSTYFRFIAGRLIHAKLLFPLKEFDDKKVEQQTFDLLSGMTCANSDK